MAAKRWSFRVVGENVAVAEPSTKRDDGRASGTPLAPTEGAWAIESIGATTPARDAIVCADFADALAHVTGGTAHRASATLVQLRAAVADLVRTGRLVVFKTARPTAVEQPKKVEVLGPESSTDEEPRDLYLLAAEVKLIGDTPLVEHPVNVIDPDTGETVAEATTDAKGIVRVEVPKKKTYRIEIVELDPQWHPEPFADDPPRGVVHFRLVDEAGEPVAQREVKVKVDEEELVFVTDDDGEVTTSAHLGVYELSVGDETFHGHSVLPGDADGDRIYEFVVHEKHEDTGPADEPDNRLARYDDAFDEDAGDPLALADDQESLA